MARLFGASSTDACGRGSGSAIDDLPNGASGMTVAAIVRRTSNGSSQYLAQKAPSYTAGWGLSIQNGGAEGQFAFQVYDSGTSADGTGNTTSANLATLNVWKCVAATFLKTTAPKLYIGDALTPMAEVSGYSASVAGPGSPATDASASYNIGNIVYPSASAPFKGDIAFVALFNRVLTAGELNLFLQFPRLRQSGCVDLADFTVTDSSTIPDFSGNGNTGTLTGASLSANPPWPRRGR